MRDVASQNRSHMLSARHLVLPVWSWVSTLINKLYNQLLLLTNPLILLRQGLPQGKQFHFSIELTSFLIRLTLNELWAAWNLVTVKSKGPSVQTIISKIKACICQRILAAHHIFPGPSFLSRGRITTFSVLTKTKH